MTLDYLVGSISKDKRRVISDIFPGWSVHIHKVEAEPVFCGREERHGPTTMMGPVITHTRQITWNNYAKLEQDPKEMELFFKSFKRHKGASWIFIWHIWTTFKDTMTEEGMSYCVWKDIGLNSSVHPKTNKLDIQFRSLPKKTIIICIKMRNYRD